MCKKFPFMQRVKTEEQQWLTVDAKVTLFILHEPNQTVGGTMETWREPADSTKKVLFRPRTYGDSGDLCTFITVTHITNTHMQTVIKHATWGGSVSLFNCWSFVEDKWFISDNSRKTHFYSLFYENKTVPQYSAASRWCKQLTSLPPEFEEEDVYMFVVLVTTFMSAMKRKRIW